MPAPDQQPLLPQHREEGGGEGEMNELDSGKERLAQVLESKTFHKVVISLITVDAICVLADLFYTFLSEDCRNQEEEEPHWLTLLSYTSLAITSLFLIEIPLHIYTFGSKYYNPFAKSEPATIHSGFHFLDAGVIVVTFVLEVFLRGKERELAGLLILLRFWRLIKLVSGVAVGVGETSEEDTRKVYELEATLREKQAQLEQLEKENKYLKDQLAKLSTSADADTEFF